MVSAATTTLVRSRLDTINLAEDWRLRAVKVGEEMWIYDLSNVDDFERREK